MSFKDYKMMWDEYGRIKGDKYIKNKFDPKVSYGFINLLRENMMLSLLNGSSDNIVLDLGCASGRQSLLIAERVKRIVGIDISENFVRIAKDNCKKNSYFLVSDGEGLPFKDGSFDKVICGEILEHLINPSMALKELKRVLMSEGKIIISIPNRNARGTLWKRIKDIFIKNRFKPLEKFSIDSINMHGDAHLRSFNLISINKFLYNEGFRIYKIKGCGFIDFPFFERLISITNRISITRKLLTFLELSLSKLSFITSLSRHLIIVVGR